MNSVKVQIKSEIASIKIQVNTKSLFDFYFKYLYITYIIPIKLIEEVIIMARAYYFQDIITIIKKNI